MRSIHNLRDIARCGRTYDGGDKGGKLENGTYVFDRGDHLALRHHRTDIARFYEDRIVFGAGGFPTRTTDERLWRYTPFRVGPLHRTKYRDYLTHGDCRIFLRGAPWFGLDHENGIACDYDGNWMPNGEDSYVSVELPRRGVRKAARRSTRAFRELLRPHLTMRWDVRIPDIPQRVRDNGNMELGHPHRIYEWFLMYHASDGHALDPADIDFVVDSAIWNARMARYSIKEALNEFIQPSMIVKRNTEVRSVHHEQVDKLLQVTGPEWTD